MRIVVLLIGFFSFVIACNHNEREITIKLYKDVEYFGWGSADVHPISNLNSKQKSKIKFPDLSAYADTHYSSIYYTGLQNQLLKDNALVLITNLNKLTSRVFIDPLNTLSFNESNSFELDSTSTLQFQIGSQSHQTTFLMKKRGLAGIPEQYLDGAVDMYSYQAKNMFYADLIVELDSFRLGLMDYNTNSRFNDYRKDRLIVYPYGDRIVNFELSRGGFLLDSNFVFATSKNTYKVISVAENGRSLQIRLSDETSTINHLKNGDKIPDYSFELANGSRMKISDFLNKDKKIVLHFWGNWCGGCIQEMPEINRIEESRGDLTFLHFNYFESNSVINRFVEQNQMKGFVAKMTEEMQKELLVHGLPRKILIDSNGTILDFNASNSSILIK